MENSKQGNAKLVGALLVGTFVGASLGLLFAPYKGQKTRRKLVKWAGNVKDLIKQEAEDIQRKTGEMQDWAEQEIDDVSQYIKESTN